MLEHKSSEISFNWVQIELYHCTYLSCYHVGAQELWIFRAQEHKSSEFLENGCWQRIRMGERSVIHPEHEVLRMDNRFRAPCEFVCNNSTLILSKFIQQSILRSIILQKQCRDPGSNRGPLDLQSNALPTELSRQIKWNLK